MNAPADMPNAIVEYSATEAGLAELRTRLAGVVFDCTTKEGDEAARKARRELVSLRTSLDKLRLQLNADDQARIKARNERAKEIEGEIRLLEDPIDKEIKAIEVRAEEAKQARIKAEAERIRAIQQRIDWIRGQVVELADASVAQITEALVALRSLPLTVELYAEFIDQAREASAATLSKLTSIHERAIENAAEAARLAEQRTQLEAQQAEQRREDEARKARQKQEDDARAARQREEDEARAAKQREEDAERARQRKTEDERLAAERAERQRLESEALQKRLERRKQWESLADPWASLERIVVAAREGASPRETLDAILADAQSTLQARAELAELDRSAETIADATEGRR